MAVPSAQPIAAVPSTAERPLWSVVVPTYNCAGYLAESLSAVLAQDLGTDAMEIVVVDDASADDAAAVVAELAGDRVRFVAQPTNVGAIRNFNRCLSESTGRLVHLLHGDDLVRPGFYSAMTRIFEANPTVNTAMCRTDYVDDSGETVLTTRAEQDESGVWHDALGVLAVSNRIRPPGVVVRRSMYESLGGFRTDLPHAADWEMWSRLAAAAPVWFENQALAAYRRHDEQDTSARVRSGANIDERIEAIRIVSEFLPPDQRRRKTRAALGYSAAFAANTALRQAKAGAWNATAAQLKATVQCAWLAVKG